MKIDVLTLFPEFFKDFNQWSIVGRAHKESIVSIDYINIRDFSLDKHNKVDDYPYGGGPGMLMQPDPIIKSINSCRKEESMVIFLSPQGEVYNQSLANKLSKEKHLILLCGHYEGIDQRVIDSYVDMEISMGDFVMTGGEIPAMAIMDSIVRLLPGALGSKESYKEDSHYNGLLQHPQYTRPYDYEGAKVPDILLSGNHKAIDEWRFYKSVENTLNKRPDLFKKVKLDKDIIEIIKKIKSNVIKD